MNERIKELADKCFSTLPHEDELEKFAELIVKECASVVAEHFDSSEPWITPKTILYHFGVEERKGWVCPKCGVDRTWEACPRGHTASITGDCPMTATAQSGVEE